jgi:hypothetical protein
VTPDQRRQAVERMLEEDSTLSQHAIAKVRGCSQKTISRDMAALGRVSANEFVTRPATKVGPRPVSPQDNGGMTRGDSLVARLRGEMAEQGLVPTSVEESTWPRRRIWPTVSSGCRPWSLATVTAGRLTAGSCYIRRWPRSDSAKAFSRCRVSVTCWLVLAGATEDHTEIARADPLRRPKTASDQAIWPCASGRISNVRRRLRRAVLSLMTIDGQS